LNADGSFTYAPNPGFTGTDEFAYKAFDGLALSNIATATIVVNNPPVANDNTYLIRPNTPVNVLAPGVLGNDTDDDNDPLTAHLVSAPAHRTITLDADGSFTYAPNPGFVGIDRFTYKAFDGTALSNVATATIVVNNPPVATGELYQVTTNTPLTV